MERTELYGAYCPKYDMTFVLRGTYRDDEIISEECLGWYHGEPNDEDNEQYSNHNYKALYT